MKRIVCLLLTVVLLWTSTGLGLFNTQAADTSSLTVVVPETIYLLPGNRSFQYYIDGAWDGETLSPAAKTTGTIRFSLDGATGISVQYAGASVSLRDIRSEPGSFMATVSGGSAFSVEGGLLRWTFSYTLNGSQCVTNAYTYLYSPYLGQTGAQAGYRYKRTVFTSGDTLTAYAFLAGIHDVSGGNYNSRFTQTASPLMSPLMPNWLESEPARSSSSRGDFPNWDQYFARVDGTGGISTVNESMDDDDQSVSFGSTDAYGVVYLDTSRYAGASFSDLPNFGAGWMMLYADVPHRAHEMKAFRSEDGRLTFAEQVEFDYDRRGELFGLYASSSPLPTADTTYPIQASFYYRGSSSSSEVTMTLRFGLHVQMVDKSALRSLLHTALAANLQEDSNAYYGRMQEAVRTAAQALGKPDAKEQEVLESQTLLNSVLDVMHEEPAQDTQREFVQSFSVPRFLQTYGTEPYRQGTDIVPGDKIVLQIANAQNVQLMGEGFSSLRLTPAVSGNTYTWTICSGTIADAATFSSCVKWIARYTIHDRAYTSVAWSAVRPVCNAPGFAVDLSRSSSSIFGKGQYRNAYIEWVESVYTNDVGSCVVDPENASYTRNADPCTAFLCEGSVEQSSLTVQQPATGIFYADVSRFKTLEQTPLRIKAAIASYLDTSITETQELDNVNLVSQFVDNQKTTIYEIEDKSCELNAGDAPVEMKLIGALPPAGSTMRFNVRLYWRDPVSFLIVNGLETTTYFELTVICYDKTTLGTLLKSVTQLNLQADEFAQQPALWSAYQTALQTAWTTYGRENVTQDMIDSALNGLNTALNRLMQVKHTFAAQTVASTCAQYGYTKFWCAECNLMYRGNFTAPAAHDWDEGRVVRKATCYVDGLKVYTCQANPYHVRQERIPAEGHSYGNWFSVKDDKQHVRTCSGCSRYSRETHTFNENTEKYVEPTADTAGKREYVCSVCGYNKTEYLPPTGCAHTYESVVTAPTCTTSGYTTYTCSVCQDTYTADYVYMKGHLYNAGKVTVQPTCTQSGTRTYTCLNDSSHTKTETLAAAGHDWGAGEVTEATCVTSGYITYTCACCGAKTTTGQTAATDLHAWGSWTQSPAATCTEPGTKVRTCGQCGRIETQTIPVVGHQYEAVVTAPTCTAPGFTVHTCTVCGDSYQDTMQQALGHAWDTGTVTRESTCTQSGVRVFTCTRDASHTRTETIPAAGHRYEAVVTAPTCTENGYTTFTCSVCGDTYTGRVTAPLGHQWGAWTDKDDENHVRSCENDPAHMELEAHDFVLNPELSIQETEEQDGIYVYECSVCHSQKTEIVPALIHAHDWVVQNVVAPTCETEGYTLYVCSKNAAHTEKREFVPAFGHAWDDGTVTTPATCISEGVRVYTCLHDPAHIRTEAVEVNVDAHSWNDGVVTVPATCEADGTILYTCKNDPAHTKTEVIPATGHNYDAVVTAPTCEAEGFTTYTCKKDPTHTYIADTVPSLGHAFGAWIAVDGQMHSRTCARCGISITDAHNYMMDLERSVEATEEAEGKRVYVCDVCGNEKVVVLPKLDHKHKYDMTVVPPACETAGYTVYTCTVCGDSFSADAVPALGHAWDEGKVTQSASCTTAGTRIFTCTRDDSHTRTEIIPAAGHKYSAAVTAPTCEENGYTVYTCSSCGNSYRAEETAALGHAYKVTESREATCTEEGFIVYTCSRNQTHTYTQTLRAKGHTFGQWTQTKASTEYEYGQKQRTCTTCGETETQQIEKLPATELTITARPASPMTYKETFTMEASEAVTWRSDNEEVLKVDPQTGKLTTVKKGTATITAMSVRGNKTASCTVTVRYAWWQVLIRVFLFGFLWY